jgi:hypothetical protein
MDPVLNVCLAAVWLGAGAVAATTMLRLFGGAVPAERRDRVTTLHRWAGRAFAALYVVALVSMALRVRESGIDSAAVVVHGALGLSLLPLLVVKILIARSWKPLHKLLPSLGIFVSVLAFTTAALGGVIFWAEHDDGDDAQALARVRDLAGRPEARQAFEAHCGRCHALARALQQAQRGSKTSQEWTQTIGEMAAKARRDGMEVWSAAEGELIVEFLVAQAGTGPAGPDRGGDEEAGDDRGRGRGRGRGR